ncbi:zinc transporter [Novosphingobium chloroacetimidivorans]|uniref:Zinc transporter n=1 Tax=Novosphingobium chloroacetimidivorans TaxID=1428314 RepID=A0A7W7K8T6_9SPHN|nr:CorA family divalent cation transporter [Novosphingobium chloroacetimidivorans]MBB4857628.1 zinc transporter [Novosphingobium chloroacetimidivorans]
MLDPTHNDDCDLDGPLLFGRVLDGRGGARAIGWEEAQNWRSSQAGEVLWLHMCRTVPGVRAWLMDALAVPEPTAELLTSDATRPRAFREGEALVATLRGINFNPGAEPEDMVSMQVWCDGQRLITLRRVALQTPRDTRHELDEGHGPVDAGSLITSLTEHMIDRMSHVILDLDEAIDTLEAGEVDCADKATLNEITRIRRECLALKRYMSPQHEALENISRDAPAWFEEHDRREIAESIDRLRRYVEDLDISKESALVLQDDVRARLLERNARTQSQLAVVATIFLPLNFIAGLLGMNVEGIPHAKDPFAFWEVVMIGAAIAGALLLLFRRLRWF